MFWFSIILGGVWSTVCLIMLLKKATYSKEGIKGLIVSAITSFVILYQTLGQ